MCQIIFFKLKIAKKITPKNNNTKYYGNLHATRYTNGLNYKEQQHWIVNLCLLLVNILEI